MTHPMHPDSPQYEELREAGRVGRESFASKPSTTCRQWLEDWSGTYYCDKPAPFVVKRSDGQGVETRFCDDHARERLGHEVPFSSRPGARVYWIVARFVCSVCDARVDYRSRLDHDGRCDRCRP